MSEVVDREEASAITTSVDIRHCVLRDTDQIPVLPEVIVRALALLNDPETEPEALQDLLCVDQALVARLLAMVNSPFFGMRRNVSTIKDGIMVLGYQNLRTLLMVTSTSKLMIRDFSCYGYETNGLWKHSVAVAAGARSLCGRLGEDPLMSEELFVAALMHDIGKMVLAPHLTAFAGDQIAGYPTISEAEVALLGISHSEAGALIAAKWNLSPLVGTVLDMHHSRTTHPQLERYVAIVRLAESIAHAEGIGYMPARIPEPRVRPADLAVLELSQEEWKSARGEMVEQVEVAISQLGSACG